MKTYNISGVTVTIEKVSRQFKEVYFLANDGKKVDRRYDLNDFKNNKSILAHLQNNPIDKRFFA